MEVNIDGTCVIIRMTQGENRINPKFVEDFNKALDHAIRYDGSQVINCQFKYTVHFYLHSYEAATCLVTISDGKYYCNGLDLEMIATMSFSEVLLFLSDVQRLLARLLTFPLVTVAAINGRCRLIVDRLKPM